MTFVFYDAETTGTDTAFDQMLQFAAIHTDADLNELDRFEIRCRLSPDIVPSPGAMRVTGVSVAQLTDTSLPSHYEMMCEIHEKLVLWSPSIFVGYNSIGFDEHLLRQAFFKSLLSPYLTSMNGNARSDVMRMVQASSLFKPDLVNLPRKGDRAVFKLDQVAPANGFSHDDAHDALADVEATIHMCRLIADQAPELWSSFMRFSQKASVADHITEETVFCLADFYFGKPYSWLVTNIGQNPANGSEFYVFDLQCDPEILRDLDDDRLIARLKKSPKPVRRLKINSCPMIAPMEDAPEITVAKNLGDEEVERRAEILANDADLRQRLLTCFDETRDVPEASPYVEMQLYDSFITDIDDLLMRRFHEAPWQARNDIVEQFTDPRLREIGKRLLHCERPDLLPLEELEGLEQARAHRLLGTQGDTPWLTLPKAKEQAEDMLSTCDESDESLLQEHRAHLQSWIEEISAIVA